MTLEVLTCDLLPERHGFFTRKGGASSGIFSGLNCGLGSSDQSEVVTINRARVAQAMEVTPDRLLTLHQVHSARIEIVAGPWNGPSPQADGMVTQTPGLALAALSADCQPVLFSEPEAGIVGAAHAGWKGAKLGVLKAMVAAIESLGGKPENIRAVIGPCISQAHYEVGPEFLETVCDGEPEAKRFFAQGANDRLQFDLPGYGLAHLKAAGCGQVEWVGHCTYADAERFFSYRRATHAKEADYGRLISVIRA